MLKPRLSKFARKVRLMPLLDQIKFLHQKIINKQKNKRFKSNNPNIVLPPDYIMFESFQLDYRKYYEGGMQTAQWVLKNISEFVNPEKLNILDWGCGPARIVRHIPELLENKTNIYATDYNSSTIEWCRNNIKDVKFYLNGVAPPLPFDSDFFGAIYGISIFTHLSAEKHLLWYNELVRVSKKGCILLLTTQGDAFREKLTQEETGTFNKGSLVIRGGVKEGHRIYSAFHPPSFMNELFGSRAKILKHIPGEKKEWGVEQDLWILEINSMWNR